MVQVLDPLGLYQATLPQESKRTAMSRFPVAQRTAAPVKSSSASARSGPKPWSAKCRCGPDARGTDRLIRPPGITECDRSTLALAAAENRFGNHLAGDMPGTPGSFRT